MTEIVGELKEEQYNYCFILGAGASYDFGYPTGLELIERITGRLKTRPQDLMEQLIQLESIRSLLTSQNSWDTPEALLENYVERLGSRLFYSGVTSIDRFLSINESNKAYQSICKYLIIEEMLESEKRSLSPVIDKNSDLSDCCYRWKQNWLRIFFGYYFVKDSVQELIKFLQAEKICIISFNYDRLFEHFIYRSIMNLYGLEISKKQDLQVLDEIVRLVPIKHVWGRFDGRDVSPRTLLQSYGNPDGLDIPELLGNIHTIRLGNQLPEDYSNLIVRSKRVYFLGFGFDELNTSILLSGMRNFDANKFIATNFGLSGRIIHKVKQQFHGQIKFSEKEESKVFDFISSLIGSG